jgi:aspartate aminotransferase-like enzyme
MLCDLTGAAHAALLLGSGTLANDVVACQLARERSTGLILSNGEFGERLVDHATRCRLRFDVLRWAWGRPFDLQEVEERLAGRPAPSWIWLVHLETSTGVLNEVSHIARRCAASGVRFCLDAVSSLGTVPVDLSCAYLASGVSGKGLRGFPGIAIVTHDHPVEPSDRLPRYLDLGLYAGVPAVPFTHSSNLLGALGAGMRGVHWDTRYREIAERTAWLRGLLRMAGYTVLADDRHAAPGVVTLALPDTVQACQVGRDLDELGYLLAYQSGYLRRRNWIQISLMSEPGVAELELLLDALGGVCENLTNA